MKRIISCLLAVLLLAAIAYRPSVKAAEENEPAFIVSSAEGHPGEHVSVTIRMENNPGIASVKMKVQFDQELTLNSITYNQSLGGKSQQPETMNAPATLNWFNGDANTTGDMDYAVLDFSVAENAAVGEHPVTITYEANDVYNIAEDNVTFRTVNGAVNVTIPVTGLALNVSSATVYTGDETYVLTPLFTPSDATDQRVSWSSSDEAVATVDGGVVTLLKKGETVITAESADGGYEASCTLTVLCSHRDCEDISAEASTCTKQGHEAYTLCHECGEVISGSDAPLPLAAHQYVQNADEAYLKSAATCISPAVYYESCSVCFEPGENTFTFGEIDPDAHAYGEPVWEWNGYDSADAKFTCTLCSDEHTAHATVTSAVTKEPTAIEAGERTYTATVILDGVTYTDTLTEVIPVQRKLGDVDADGKVDIFDVSSIQKSIAGMLGYVNYKLLDADDLQLRVADVDADGKVDIFDASLIQKWMAGNTAAQTYGIGEPMEL